MATAHPGGRPPATAYVSTFNGDPTAYGRVTNADYRGWILHWALEDSPRTYWQWLAAGRPQAPAG